MGSARRRLRDSNRHSGERRLPKIDGELPKKKSHQEQDHRWNQEQQEAEAHRHRVAIHADLIVIETAKPGGQDDQRQSDYCRSTPSPFQEVTMSHGHLVERIQQQRCHGDLYGLSIASHRKASRGLGQHAPRSSSGPDGRPPLRGLSAPHGASRSTPQSVGNSSNLRRQALEPQVHSCHSRPECVRLERTNLSRAVPSPCSAASPLQ